ncbi:MAG: hypothetical protein QM747_13545 [Nocardioides sp.]
MRAYQRADRLANGANVEAILGVAESLFAQDQDSLRGAAGKLFERALEIDPTSQKALFYSAFAALGRGELPVARERLSRMLASNPPPQIREILEKSIANIDSQVAQQAAGQGTAPADANAKVSVHVTLSPRYQGGARCAVVRRRPRSEISGPAVRRQAAASEIPSRRRTRRRGRDDRVAAHHRRAAAGDRRPHRARRHADGDQRRPVRTS